MTPKPDLIGQTLAHYEITAHLGSGGMGEVYRARDTKLARDVAVKVLPEAFTDDPDRVGRFQREATTLAKLQHTHIATVYGFEKDAARPFLVMELVEGDDLSQRLKQGPLPVDEALHLAGQIAEGLEAAHALGVVHRDLKPANIKLTPAGDVKILDFGLAKAYAAEGDPTSTIEISNSPTMTAGMTLAGTIIGTAAYMSPEQARGKRIDRQSDVWAFGAVLFEMLTGQRLFGGETVSDSIGAILHRDPDLDRLPPVPAQVRTLLRRCLARDKKLRLRDMGDARLDLADAEAALGTPQDGGAATAGANRTAWVAAAVLAVAFCVTAFWALTRDTAAGPREITVGIPRDESIFLNEGAFPTIGFAPGGTHLLHRGRPDDQLYLRAVDGFTATPVAGARNVELFTVSPDGQWLAYTAQSRLWKVAFSGGAPVALCETAYGPGLAWGDGEIYFTRSAGGGLWAVSDGGGEPRPISTLDDDKDETSHRWPHVLPGGRHLLVTVKTARMESFDEGLIAVLDLASGDVRVVLEGGTFPRYVPTGHIVYSRGDQLLAVPFDLDALAVTGTPTPMLDGVIMSPVNGGLQVALGPRGELAYIPADGPLTNYEFVWVHTSGKITPQPMDETRYYAVDISPDGTRLVGMRSRANDILQVYDLERGVRSRLTTTPGNDDSPLWSPDGRLVAYTNDRDGDADIYLVAADGSMPGRPLFGSEMDDYPATWTPDGRTLIFARVDKSGRSALWRMNIEGEQDAEPLFSDEIFRGWSALSPDGRLLAFVSDMSGDLDVHVCRYPELDRTVRVSVDGGRWPAWADGGATLYYRTDDTMMAVAVSPDPSGRNAARVGEPREVFPIPHNYYESLALHPDGDRFLALRYPEESHHHYGVRVVFDWLEQLEGLGK